MPTTKNFTYIGVYITPRQNEQIRKLTYARVTTKSAIVRDMIDSYIKASGAKI